MKEHEKINDDKSVEGSESTGTTKMLKKVTLIATTNQKKIKIRKVRKTNRLHKTMDEKGKKIIINYMEDWIKRGRDLNNPFKKLAIKLKDSCGHDYDSKAICDYYWNILDPRLDHSSFSPEEKNYIYDLIVEYLRTNNGPISWKVLQYKLKEKFGKFCSRNSIKNVWNSNKRRNDRLAKIKGNEVNMYN